MKLGWAKMKDELRVDYVTPNAALWKILAAHRKETPKQVCEAFEHRTFIALDPGETTGVAIWDGQLEHVELFQIETKEVGQAHDDLLAIMLHFKPDHLRVEEYRVYSWMADSHSWAVLHTPQLIGAIRVLARKCQIPLDFKMAQHAKAMWTDDNLKRVGLYNPGLKHARDAERHLLYYMAKPTDVDA
jgi:hypothetical protein